MIPKPHFQTYSLRALEGGGVVVSTYSVMNDRHDAAIFAGSLDAAVVFVHGKLTPPPPEPTEAQKAVNAAVKTLEAVGVVFQTVEPVAPVSPYAGAKQAPGGHDPEPCGCDACVAYRKGLN